MNVSNVYAHSLLTRCVSVSVCARADCVRGPFSDYFLVQGTRGSGRHITGVIEFLDFTSLQLRNCTGANAPGGGRVYCVRVDADAVCVRTMLHTPTT
jgi:hypothetical protein